MANCVVNVLIERKSPPYDEPKLTVVREDGKPFPVVLHPNDTITVKLVPMEDRIRPLTFGNIIIHPNRDKTVDLGRWYGDSPHCVDAYSKPNGQGTKIYEIDRPYGSPETIVVIKDIETNPGSQSDYYFSGTARFKNVDGGRMGTPLRS